MRTIAFVGLLAVSFLGACRDEDGAARSASAALAGEEPGAEPGGELIPSLDVHLADWPAASVRAAGEMVEKYGEPAEITPTMLVWHDTGDFLHTLVFREEIRHDFPMPHTDVLQQFVPYRVPIGRFDDLAAFDGSVVAERTSGMLSARCDEEGANYLAINLAHEIVEGMRTVEEARTFYGEQILLVHGGEPSPYVDGLLFEPQRRAATGDPDVSTIEVVEGGEDDHVD